MERVYLALGSNLGDRQANLEAAITALSRLAGVVVVQRASVIETEALVLEGAEAQPRYLNTVVGVDTSLEPHALLAKLKALEVQLGRTPSPKWSARTIDLDLVLWGDRIVDSETLSVPHPQLHHRAFVLGPLSELAPDLVHPSLRLSIRQLLARLSAA